MSVLEKDPRRVVRLRYSEKLNASLPIKEQATIKAFLWSSFLNEGLRPLSWETDEVGTKIKVVSLWNDRELAKAIEELQEYAAEIRRTVGVPLNITFSIEGPSEMLVLRDVCQA